MLGIQFAKNQHRLFLAEITANFTDRHGKQLQHSRVNINIVHQRVIILVAH